MLIRSSYFAIIVTCQFGQFKFNSSLLSLYHCLVTIYAGIVDRFFSTCSFCFGFSYNGNGSYLRKGKNAVQKAVCLTWSGREFIIGNQVLWILNCALFFFNFFKVQIVLFFFFKVQIVLWWDVYFWLQLYPKLCSDWWPPYSFTQI